MPFYFCLTPSRRTGRLSRPAIGRAVAVLALFLYATPPSLAQLPQARLYSVFPCGGKAGTTFELTLTDGADLDEVDTLLVNAVGVTATPKMRASAGRQEPVPNVFNLTIPRDVPTGVYELYAGGLFGLTNPRVFVVGSQDETREAEPNNDPAHANPLRLNQIVNGTINGPTDVDVFRFEGKKGQRIIAWCRAADLDSRLSAVIELLTRDGRRLGYGREIVRRDPMIDATLPEDGSYLVKVHDFEFRGGPEYVYRLSVGTGPYLDYMLPPAGVPGTTAKYALYGRNLPGGRPSGLMIDGRPLDRLEVEISLPSVPPVAPAHTTLRSAAAGIPAVSYVYQAPAGESNPVLIQLIDPPPVLEKEPNDSPATAQHISVPAEFVGQFQVPGDTDYVTFEAKAQQVFDIEVFANRVGSLADPTLVVEQVERDSKGHESTTQIASIDDDNSNIAPNVFDTRSDDPSYRFQAPADGTYRIMLRDRAFESRGDPRLIYRLSIRPEQPDFRVVALQRYPVQGSVKEVSTWALGLRKGDSRDLELLVLRRDGFREPIDVWAEGLPPGVECRGAAIPANTKTSSLIFTAAPHAKECCSLIRIFAKARLSDPNKVAAAAKAARSQDAAATAASQAEQVAAAAGQTARSAIDVVATLTKVAGTQPADATLAHALADAQATAASAEKAARSAAEFAASAKKKLAAARVAADAASAAAAPADVVHEVIPGEIVWSAAPDAPAHSRIGQSLALSVMKEAAPVQVSTGTARIEANQSQQIVIPFSVVKRTGSSDVVTLTVDGLPANDLSLPAKQLIKGKGPDALRLFVKRFARVGTYTLFWTAQAGIAYRHHVAAAERAAAEQAQAAKKVAGAEAAAKAALGRRDHAVQTRALCGTALKNAQASLAAARKVSAAADQIVETAVDHQTRLERALVERAAHAAGKVPHAEDPRDSVPAAERRLADARLVAAKAAESVETAKRKVAETETALATAEQARHEADAIAKDAQSRAKAAQAEKQSADRKAQEAAKAAAPQILTDFAPSTPVRITIKRAPVEIIASVPRGGAFKRRGRADIKVKLKRARGFKGPVTVDLPLPAGVKGLKAEPIVIAPEKNEAIVQVTADAKATTGPLADLIIRGRMDFEGKSEVDAPIALKVLP